MTSTYFLICYYFYFGKIRKFLNPKIGSGTPKNNWTNRGWWTAPPRFAWCTAQYIVALHVNFPNTPGGFPLFSWPRSIDFMELSAAPKNTRWDNDKKIIRGHLNAGCLIGILKMVYYNLHITAYTLPPSKTLKYKKYRFFRDFNGLGRDGREGMGGRLAQCMKRLKVFSILLGRIRHTHVAGKVAGLTTSDSQKNGWGWVSSFKTCHAPRNFG